MTRSVILEARQHQALLDRYRKTPTPRFVSVPISCRFWTQATPGRTSSPCCSAVPGPSSDGSNGSTAKAWRLWPGTSPADPFASVRVACRRPRLGYHKSPARLRDCYSAPDLISLCHPFLCVNDVSIPLRLPPANQLMPPSKLMRNTNANPKPITAAMAHTMRATCGLSVPMIPAILWSSAAEARTPKRATTSKAPNKR